VYSDTENMTENKEPNDQLETDSPLANPLADHRR